MGESGGETVLYIASLTEEVARLARAHGFDALAYLFDLARLEADEISKSLGGYVARPSGTQD